MSNPDSETCDLIIGQSKFYKNISKDEVINALNKMKLFYDDMKAGHYEKFNDHVKSRFLTLNAETSEESKIHFVFYTSAPSPKKFDAENIKKQILSQFPNSDKIEISILFVADIIKEIETANAIKQVVERGKILIDEKDNYLIYGDNAVIVNVSAFSIKELYTTHNINLLAQNLRYHVSGGSIDKDIRDTIKDNPESFWLKNNGITIICDDFCIDGREVHLKNFSIIIAFTALAARYAQGNLNDEDINLPVDKLSDLNYDRLRDIANIKYLLLMKLYTDSYDTALEKLFKAIIDNGFDIYYSAHDYNKSLTAGNFLKKDDNYYLILQRRWRKLRNEIHEVFKLTDET